MIKIEFASKQTGRIVKTEISILGLLQTSEEGLFETLTECNCTQLKESGYDPCMCDSEWDDGYILKISDEKETYTIKR